MTCWQNISSYFPTLQRNCGTAQGKKKKKKKQQRNKIKNVYLSFVPSLTLVGLCQEVSISCFPFIFPGTSGILFHMKQWHKSFPPFSQGHLWYKHLQEYGGMCHCMTQQLPQRRRRFYNPFYNLSKSSNKLLETKNRRPFQQIFQESKKAVLMTKESEL